MPLSWNEIKDRALRFSREWKGEGSERAEAQSFWNGFFDVFGIDRRRVAIFEKQVEITRAGRKLKRGRIDAFWKGVLLIEHKSAGEDLDCAFAQASDYFDGLPDRDLPRYILVSDFAHFRLYDLEADTTIEFRLGELHQKVRHFGFIAGYRTQEIEPQNPVNIRAAEADGEAARSAQGERLHRPPARAPARARAVLPVRRRYRHFPARGFLPPLARRTHRQGRFGPRPATGAALPGTEPARRRAPEDAGRAVTYVPVCQRQAVRGDAAAGVLRCGDAAMRETLLDCCALDWSAISPADLRRAVPVDHGREGAAQPRRALHVRGEHPEAHQAAVPRRACGRSSARSRATGTGCSTSTSGYARSRSSIRPAAAATSSSSPTASCASWSWRFCARRWRWSARAGSGSSTSSNW